MSLQNIEIKWEYVFNKGGYRASVCFYPVFTFLLWVPPRIIQVGSVDTGFIDAGATVIGCVPLVLPFGRNFSKWIRQISHKKPTSFQAEFRSKILYGPVPMHEGNLETLRLPVRIPESFI